jgi:predicted small secreted protein
MNSRKLILPMIAGVFALNFTQAQIISFTALNNSYTYKAEVANEVFTVDAFSDANGGHIVTSKIENNDHKLLISYPSKVCPAFVLVNKSEYIQIPSPNFDLTTFELVDNNISWQANTIDKDYTISILGFKQGIPSNAIQEINANTISGNQIFDIHNLSYAQFVMQVKFKGALVYTSPFITNPNLARLFGNPVKENIILESFHDGVNFSLKNVFGQNIFSGKLISGTNKIKLPLSDKGLYLLVLHKDDQSQNFKVILE